MNHEDSQSAVSGDSTHWLNRLDRATVLAENLLLLTLLGSMLGIAVWQIVARNLFSTGFIWADEYLRLAVLWIALTGSMVAARDHRHLRIDLLSRMLPPSLNRWADFIADTVTAIVCAILAWYSLLFVLESHEYEDLAFDALPLWWFQSILPLGFLIIGIRYAIWAIRRLTTKPGEHITESAT